MNALVKKEIGLLRPGWTVAMLLALVQTITRPGDFYVGCLLFFGFTLMALATIGRETSLNTFSSLLALPAERVRIWQLKLSVLAGGFLTVFVVWLAAYGIAFLNFHDEVADHPFHLPYEQFLFMGLIATTTITGGLWTTLLLRQLAGAFWLTLLVPVTITGFAAALFADSEFFYLGKAVLSVLLGLYSLAGFLFARRLFFRAQDTGWSGGIVALPEWTFLSSRGGAGEGRRKRGPIFALLKKELLLQQGVLTGAAGLLGLHAGIIGLRVVHRFPKDSAGEVLTAIFWMLWLVLPVLLGCIAVAEERKLGMLESQLCLPASRRAQFASKTLLTLGLGVMLGGVMPLLLEFIAAILGAKNPAFAQDNRMDASTPVFYVLTPAILGGAAWITLVSLFASSLAKNFLHAFGIALVTLIGLLMFVPAFSNHGMVFFDSIAPYSILPLIVAVPTLVVTLLWQAYLNYQNFCEGWLLCRRILLGASGALVFTVAVTAALYHRAWEVFEPAEPAHGPARMSLANPPLIRHQDYIDEVLVQLPDGRAWFDRIGYARSGCFPYEVIRATLNPLPGSIGPERFISGSNWVSTAMDRFSRRVPGQATNIFVCRDVVGIKSDGTLWLSEETNSPLWSGDRMTQVGEETNWQTMSSAWHGPWVLLLKTDGTLWRWGADSWSDPGSVLHWAPLRGVDPSRLGTNSDWTRIAQDGHLQKADGSVWWITLNHQNGQVGFLRDTNWDLVDLDKIPEMNPFRSYVRKDGTLWISIQTQAIGFRSKFTLRTFQADKEPNWVSVAAAGWMGSIVALKSDGTLWQWQRQWNDPFAKPLLTRLGIHNDWVALAAIQEGVVSLAADGSLWLWPDRSRYETFNHRSLLQLPKQPQFLGNVFREAN